MSRVEVRGCWQNKNKQTNTQRKKTPRKKSEAKRRGGKSGKEKENERMNEWMEYRWGRERERGEGILTHLW